MNERSFYYIGIAFFGMINGIFNPLFLVRLPDLGLPDGGAAFRQHGGDRLFRLDDALDRHGDPRRHSRRPCDERFIGAKDDSTVTSLWIWLAGTAHLDPPGDRKFPENRL